MKQKFSALLFLGLFWLAAIGSPPDPNWEARIIAFEIPYIHSQRSDAPAHVQKDESALVDIFRGGHSVDVYEYVLFRKRHDGNAKNVEAVFFNSAGQGFMVPVRLEFVKEGVARIFLEQVLMGEFGRLDISHELILSPDKPNAVLINSTTIRKKRELIFSKTERKARVFELKETVLPRDLIEKACSIRTQIE